MKNNYRLTAEELRKSILQLAIQGKLVKQNLNDEPASVLVEKIYEEKRRLIAEGKIKKDKQESYIFKGDDNCYYEKIGNNAPVKLDDLPFDIPDSWTWIRLKDLIHIQTGASFKKEQSIQESKEGFIRVLRGGNILPFQYLLKGDDLYIPQELVSDDIILKKNDLITPAVTSLENIGKIAVINSELNGVTAGGFVYIFRPYLNGIVISNLIADYVSSSAYQSMMKDITKKSGQAFYNMNKEKLLQLYFPIAPFAEMKRIVKKVNKCEPLIAAYSIAEGKLSALEEEFPEKLKKSILQYAIEGKLVKQDPNDEPASVLLERIKQEKEQLIREGKIKRDKNESYIYQGDDKNYYENLPFGWKISSLKSISLTIKAGGDKPKDHSNNQTDLYKYPIVANGIKNNGIVGYSKKYEINAKSITISGRGTIGFPLIREYEYTPIVRLIVIIPSKNINLKYLSYSLSLKCNIGVGTSIQQLTIPMIEDLKIEIPPFLEQERISSKIESIFTVLGFV